MRRRPLEARALGQSREGLPPAAVAQGLEQGEGLDKNCRFHHRECTVSTYETQGELPMRVGVIALQHESNTFGTKLTTLADFERDHVLKGDAVRRFMQEAHHEMGGF